MEFKTILFSVAAFAGVAVSADSSWSQTQPIDLTNIVVENYAADQFGTFTYSFSYFDPLFYAIGNCSGTGDNCEIAAFLSLQLDNNSRLTLDHQTAPATCEVGDPFGGEGLIYPSVSAGPLYGSEHDYKFNLTIDANYVSA